MVSTIILNLKSLLQKNNNNLKFYTRNLTIKNQ